MTQSIGCSFHRLYASQIYRPSVAKWLASLASIHRLLPLCGPSPTSDNAENLSQYDPGCIPCTRSFLTVVHYL